MAMSKLIAHEKTVDQICEKRGLDTRHFTILEGLNQADGEVRNLLQGLYGQCLFRWERFGR